MSSSKPYLKGQKWENDKVIKENVKWKKNSEPDRG